MTVDKRDLYKQYKLNDTLKSQFPDAVPVELNVNDLQDVNANNPTNNSSLSWDSVTSKWVPKKLLAEVGQI